MQHYRSFEKPWYDGRAIENNPLSAINRVNGKSGLENVVVDVSVNSDHYVNNNPNSPGYARRIVGKIFSVMPTPVGKIVLIGSLVSSLGIGVVACDNQPTAPTPKKQEQTTTQTPTITFESTYKVIFPYKEPSGSLEEKVYNDTDVVTYMKFVRMKEDVKWAKSLAELVNKSWSPSNWKDFFDKNKELGELTPYIPLEDIGKYQQSQPYYQGTRNVDSSGKPIIAKPRYFQETLTGKLIPIENPDMDKQMFDELKKMFSSQKETHEQSRIAFDSDRDGNLEVYVMNADGSGQKKLANNSADDWNPFWSPDGKKIAFTSDRDGNWEIYVMNADGSGQKKLTNNSADDWEPSWSPFLSK